MRSNMGKYGPYGLAQYRCFRIGDGIVYARVLVDMEDEAKALSEFQTPIVFDWDCNFDCSTFYKPPKIVKVITHILYTHENVSTIYF